MSLPQVTREKLAEVFKTPETMRAFDYLLRELQFTPEQLADVIQAAATAQSTADGAVSNAATAQASADAAQADITAHEALTSAHGVTGNIVGTQGVQILKDKTLDGSTPMINQTLSTGTATPALTANKPGASTAISTWLQITVNGTNYVVPLYLPT